MAVMACGQQLGIIQKEINEPVLKFRYRWEDI